MDDNSVNAVINKYVKDNLSPTEKERNYIASKYDELKIFLKCNCFRSGSFARYTAICPVHDLDVIHPVPDATIENNPGVVLDSLYALLDEGYSKSTISKIKSITRQSHSITVEFADSEEPFSIDIVPAIELTEEPMNEYGEPFYRVPEILRLNKFNRLHRYEMAEEKPIEWIKTDPRGYRRAAKELNDINPNFRHATKLGKGWRHICKVAYGDDFGFKSFHFELIFHKYFIDNPQATTLDAAIDCFGAITHSLSTPQFRDRADNNRFVDEYVNTMTPKEKQLILKLQADAYRTLRKIQSSSTPDEIRELLESLLDVKKVTHTAVPVITAISTPHQPWGY